METMSNHKAAAKSFCNMHLSMLTDTQYARTVTALTKLLEYVYTLGLRDGKKAET